MQGFGRLEPSIDPYFKGDIETDRFYYTSELTADPISYDVSGLPAGSIHDVWAVGPILGLRVWGRAYGSGLYGMGAYGYAPAVLDTLSYGVPVNSAAITLRLADSSSLTVARYLATFLGSIRIADCGGKIKCHTSYDEAREWGIWNRHNQRPIVLKGGSSPGPADLSKLNQYSPQWAPFQLNENAHLKIFSGRPISVDVRYQTGSFLYIAPGQAAIVQGAVGWDSTDTPSGMWFGHSFESGNPILCGASQQQAEFINQSSVGLHKAYPLIKTQGVLAGSAVNDGHSAIAMFNQELRMMLTAEWMG